MHQFMHVIKKKRILTGRVPLKKSIGLLNITSATLIYSLVQDCSYSMFVFFGTLVIL